MAGTTKRILLGAGLVTVFLTIGCGSSVPLRDQSVTKSRQQKQQPKFLEDITLKGNCNNITIDNTEETRERKERNHKYIHGLQSKYASVLGVLPQTISNLGLYHFIEEWYGVKYRFGGNDKDGIDCSAFAQKLYENVFCMNLFRSAMEQFQTCQLITDTDSLKEGDLVFFRTRGKRISHVGVYLMNNYFVHASTSQGVVISNLNDSYWSRYFAGAGKIRNEKEVGYTTTSRAQ